MKPILLVCAAVGFYAASNMILERKLSQVPTATLLIYCLPVMWILAIIIRAMSTDMGEKIPGLPINTIFWFVVLNALIWFLADYCYLNAYNNGGSAIMITTVTIMLPAIITVAKYLCFSQLPTQYHIYGWLAAVVAVLLVTKGETLIKTSSF